MPERVCAREGCSESLEGRSPKALYCTIACARVQRKTDKQVPDTRTCAECQKPLDGLRSDAVYCSTICGDRVRGKRWRDSDLDNSRALAAKRQQRWRQNHPEQAAEDRDRWFRENPERRRAYKRTTDWRRRARMAGSPVGTVSADTIQARFDYFGGKCWMCGVPATSIDHVKPLAKGGAHIASNLRPACTPCNSSKQHKWFGVAELHRFVSSTRTEPSV